MIETERLRAYVTFLETIHGPTEALERLIREKREQLGRLEAPEQAA